MTNEHIEFIKNFKRRKRIILFSQVSLLIFIILLWELLSETKLIDPFIFSAPSSVFKLFIDYLKTFELIRHSLVSTFEVLIGLFLGTFFGILIAIILYEFKIIDKILEPFLVVFNALPKTALAPILIIWAGANLKGIVVVSISISLIITIINAKMAFNNVDSDKVKLFKTLNATKFKTLWYLILPASKEELLNIIKINIGMSWIGVIVGEFIVSKEGLGYLITYGSQVFRMDLVIMGITTLALITLLMYQTLNFLLKIIREKNK